jgi:hypothetical protein
MRHPAVVAALVAAVASVLVAAIGILPTLRSTVNAQVATSTTDELKSRAAEVDSIADRFKEIESKLAAVEEKASLKLESRCEAKKALSSSSSVTYGKGSIAECPGGMIAIGGACEVSMSRVGTNSRFYIVDGGSVGFECILAQGTDGDSVTATAICCA